MLECAGDGALRREPGRGGDVLEVCVGGDGTAGGTSRLLEGDLDKRSTNEVGGFGGREGGREGGGYASLAGRYLSMFEDMFSRVATSSQEMTSRVLQSSSPWHLSNASQVRDAH